MLTRALDDRAQVSDFCEFPSGPWTITYRYMSLPKRQMTPFINFLSSHGRGPLYNHFEFCNYSSCTVSGLGPGPITLEYKLIQKKKKVKCRITYQELRDSPNPYETGKGRSHVSCTTMKGHPWCPLCQWEDINWVHHRAQVKLGQALANCWKCYWKTSETVDGVWSH